MKKIVTGFEIVDSAGDSVERCICSEDSAVWLYEAECGCQCGCKGPSGDVANAATNGSTALFSQIQH
jgi:hypothetical protein